MCGIAGIFEFDALALPPDAGLGLRMADSLVHRGPDDGGLLVAPGLLLAHRRLAVIDLSLHAHQPMCDRRGWCWLVFNGEIYNFRECRRKLESLGRRFRSDSDTEVLLEGYLEWGMDVLPELNGMFAFALWDCRDDTLWLARDPMGIKPLFYSERGAFRFGSEIKAILADDRIPAHPDWESLDRFLTFGYPPAPSTGFDGIRQVMPGEWIRVARTGKVTRRRWEDLPYPSGPPGGAFRDSVDRLDAALASAVERQMVSDVPLGALLSGGLDSSAIVRAMARRGGGGAVETFTIGFEDPRFDESTFAAEVARTFGTRHHARRVDPDVASILTTIVSHAEEPLADHSAIPFHLLSESVRKQVTVALSGDGADELLGGYMTYRASQLAPYYRAIPGPIRRSILGPLARRLPLSRGKYGASMLLRRFVDAAERPFPFDHCGWRRMVSSDLRRRLLTPERLAALPPEPLAPYADALAGAPDWLDPLARQLHLDLTFHLPNDMLVKVDRMSMAHALEVRVPWLDREVVRACLAMPSGHKRRGNKGKMVLAAMLHDDLPPAILRRRKAGFVMPLEQWLRCEWQPLLRSALTAEFAHQTGAFQWTCLESMIDEHALGRGDHAYALFTLLVMGIWWRVWITGETRRSVRRPDAAPTQVHRVVRSQGGYLEPSHPRDEGDPS
ncbi:MAG: asparagine synthase (glutamine-hydrolyzing) [Planctomycetes bacterium]|nr:asparagine synthase (glutamine-hydrolyzing) [Planctomycetota bacterium]